MRDIRGLPQSQTDPDGNTTDYTYDEAGQPAVTVAPAVSAETYGSAAAQVRPVTTDGYDTFGEETQWEDQQLRLRQQRPSAHRYRGADRHHPWRLWLCVPVDVNTHVDRGTGPEQDPQPERCLEVTEPGGVDTKRR
jgi:YD repeat-containing protein